MNASIAYFSLDLLKECNFLFSISGSSSLYYHILILFLFSNIMNSPCFISFSMMSFLLFDSFVFL